MNVLIAADYRAPNSGNFIASLLELAEKMRDCGNTTIFVFPDNGNGGYTWSRWLKDSGFLVYLLDMTKDEEEKVCFLAAIIENHNVDLIHTHFGLCHRILLTRRKDLNNVKVLIHDHMDFSPEGNIHKQKLRTLIWSALYQVNRIGVISVMERKYKSYWLTSKKRNWYIPNGLSLRRNVPFEMTRKERREQLGLEDKQKLCLFLGWDMYRKGGDIAIKAVAALHNQNEDIHLGLLGFSDKPSEKVLSWIQYRTGIDPVCDWIHFYSSTEDMFSYHRAADVYLSASRKEAFSYGLLEAISQNTPIVVSDIEGTAWAKEYDKCFLYPVEDAQICAEKLKEALEVTQVQSNRDVIISRYSINGWCEKIIDIYTRMLM